jgi:hypothetical protein
MKLVYVQKEDTFGFVTREGKNFLVIPVTCKGTILPDSPINRHYSKSEVTIIEPLFRLDSITKWTFRYAFPVDNFEILDCRMKLTKSDNKDPLHWLRTLAFHCVIPEDMDILFTYIHPLVKHVDAFDSLPRLERCSLAMDMYIVILSELERCEGRHIFILAMLLGGSDIITKEGQFSSVPQLKLCKASEEAIAKRWSRVIALKQLKL